jgi:Flp pilus assembly pilin Flp
VTKIKQRKRARQRGAASVEYLVAVTLLTLALGVTLVSLGPGMALSWSYSRAVLYGNAP